MGKLKIYIRGREFVDDHAGTIDSSVSITYAQKVIFSNRMKVGLDVIHIFFEYI